MLGTMASISTSGLKIGSPAFSLFSGEWRNLAVRQPFLGVLHPAVLKTKFEGTNITSIDQFSGFDGKIGMDLFHQLAGFLHPHPPGGAERQVVGAKRCSG